MLRGEELAREFPLIHAVGKGSPRAPRLVELRWRPERARKMTLVGKGVCFDSGGLDIKPESAMGLMKKDMGGAASSLAAAAMIMAADVDVSLRLLIPIVENSVSGEAFRPGDVYPSRKGLSVEIGNTDAEGRLILADALALADEEKPELLIDFATLTGAARVALGPDLPPFYTDDEALAEAIARHGAAANDPVWRLPLWKAYDVQARRKNRRSQQRPARRHGRLDHGGACSCAVSCPRASPGRISTFTAGRRAAKPGRPGRRRGAGGAAGVQSGARKIRDGKASVTESGDWRAARQLNFDKRLTPARPDLAAEYLREQIVADAYAPGPPHAGPRLPCQCAAENLPTTPPTDTQALHGETLIVYEEKGWLVLGANSIATAMSAISARRPSPKTSQSPNIACAPATP